MKNLILFFSASLVILFNACANEEVYDDLSPLQKPVVNDPIDINDNSFIAAWNFVSTAKSYRLDVSLQNDFSSYIQGYESLEVAGLNATVAGLTPGTQYFFRVKAVREAELSDYSNVVMVTTSGTLIDTDVNLKDKAADNFFVGAALSTNRLTGGYNELLTTEFNSITAESEMKMRTIFAGPSDYNWTRPDELVQYATENELNIHGHALIWHEEVPDWMRTFTGSNEEFEMIIEDYIKAVVTRYSDKITSWDVVNEAISDGGGIRNTIFLEKLGSNYIAKCFQWAREADPDVLLFYNDYNTPADLAKQQDVYALIDDLQANNISIDGIGLQMHISIDSPTRQEIQDDVDMALQRNLIIHFSELDIRVNPDGRQMVSSLTEEREIAQRLKCKEVVDIYNDIPEAFKYAITVWGLRDPDSWIINHHNRPDWPLLFDDSFNRKSAHIGFLEGLE
ncbi:endo-1,4-beta-xylanase [Marivirga arenosa]|uniref:Beta-xylanase n=1 Tax=Marivirga arenosa TaxID=3059076 RepID=A0AA49GFG3_9BACT|nr:endo-1,4-beta-xylanase [Marivirga sp. ABR2-2]WKK87821.2 endo-1,4-beta-xylanase [Marivirga sp. ABR2-2]